MQYGTRDSSHTVKKLEGKLDVFERTILKKECMRNEFFRVREKLEIGVSLFFYG